jgi:hypothetical protein
MAIKCQSRLSGFRQHWKQGQNMKTSLTLHWTFIQEMCLERFWPQSEVHTAMIVRSQVLQNVTHGTWDITTAL